MHRGPRDHGAGVVVLAVLLFSAAAGADVRTASRPAIPRTAIAPVGDDYVVPAPGGSRGRRTHEVPGRRRIFFPPDPPPLGAQINFGTSVTARARVLEELATVIMEPFYAPWSTCLLDQSDVVLKKFRPRVEAHLRSRAALLAELRAALVAGAQVSPDERYAALVALATRQAVALTRLEAAAEDLRNDLAAKVSWYDLREWKLGRSSLGERRPEHRVLEFQLVRAAAYYQEGLLPAQRRLLREAAMAMQDEIFTGDLGTGEPPPPLLFFSPDLARLLPVSGYPEAVATRLEDFGRAKDALRQEVVDTIIEQDKARFFSVRRRALETLARAQASRLAALDLRAEEIRREYAPEFARRQRPAPVPFADDLAASVQSFLAQHDRLQRGFERRKALVRARVIQESQGQTFGVVRAKIAEEITREAERYVRDSLGEVRAMERMLDQLHPRLVPHALADGFTSENVGTRFVVEYMRHRREAAAYHEYEIAVWEPGLSPAQRQLLLGGAMERLELPLPGPEHQPTRLPATLLDPTAE